MDYNFTIDGLANDKVLQRLRPTKRSQIKGKQDIVNLFKAAKLDLTKATLTDNYTGERKTLAQVDQELNN